MSPPEGTTRWWGVPAPTMPTTLFECASCGWEEEREERPTFCPKCGSAYVAEYEPEGDHETQGDGEPEAEDDSP